MNDPVRLLDGGADDFEAKLLRAGRADAMPAHSRKQILAGIGIGGLLTASTMASGVRAAAKGWLTTLGAGTVSAVAVWAGVHAVTAKPDATPAAPAAKVAPASPARVPDAPPAVAEIGPAREPVPDRAAAPAAPAPKLATRSATDTSLAAELALIEQARSAFLGHDYGQALRLLDDYARRFPKQKLGTEATVLRIESLAGRGDRDSAARVGHEFLQNHPNGPYAQRVRSVIGEGSASAHAP